MFQVIMVIMSKYITLDIGTYVIFTSIKLDKQQV